MFARTLAALIGLCTFALPAIAQLDAVPETAKAEYRRGVTLERLDDRAGADRQYVIACDAGDPRGCLAIAHSLRAGNQVPQDFERSADFYARACDAGAGAGCAGLAYQHTRGLGVPQDFDRAIEIYRDGCDLGEMSACAGAGNLLFTGTGSQRDRRTGGELLRKACDGDYTWACERLRDLGQPRG